MYSNHKKYYADLLFEFRYSLYSAVEIYRRIEPNNRTKAVTVTLQPTPNRRFYIFPVFGAITFFLLFYVAAILILCIYDRYEKRRFALVRCQADLFVESSSTRTVYGSMSTRQPISSPTRTHSLFPNIPDSSAQPDQTHCMARSWHSDETETRPQRRLSIAGSVSPLPHSADSECALTVPVHGSRSCELYSSPPEPANPVLTENQPSPTAMPGDEQEADFIGDSTTAIQPKSSKPSRPSKTRRRIPKFARPTSCVTRPFDHPSSGDEEPTTEFHSDLGSNVPAPNGNRSTTIPSLIDLSRKPYTQLNRKYLLYFWFLIIVSIFYGLPAVQLIMIYQKTLIETGNEDLCYYNFECARPLGIFTAFNNIISNVGYVMLGLLFLALTARRDLIHRRALKLRPAQTQTRGVPQHYGLYYSMGLALTMEGIMSACYHMCPSFSNFQFDTAYMYILAMLIMLKIYQTRHPDVNATAHSAYMVMAVVIFLGVTGVIYGSETFWIAFTVFFLLMSVVLTAEIYYMGHWNIDLCLPRRLYSLIQSDGIHCLRPMYLERMLLLLIANVINFALAGYGIVARPRNFSSFLLTIFMVNMLVYTMFYILMKVTLLSPLFAVSFNGNHF
ncbi:SID1 transmembrane family member 1 [Fasciola gigantica]|uniref:SID1 transmembrane family member 1 n=1 Tax=Fasciola gigantica TaxID=46835 RepID=A0A504YNX4_FASGI|nr:SID1 transmembrane family member 1 [Fasciola gigantica]